MLLYVLILVLLSLEHIIKKWWWCGNIPENLFDQAAIHTLQRILGVEGDLIVVVCCTACCYYDIVHNNLH